MRTIHEAKRASLMRKAMRIVCADCRAIAIEAISKG